MPHDVFLALLGYAFVSLVTPGPNNLMLMASGVNFGLRASVAHIAGVSLGFGAMVLLVGLGLAALFHAVPAAVVVLKVVSVAYMLWLALKIARAGAPRPGKQAPKPISFLQAVSFQWVNPKAWAMAVTATSIYAPTQSLHEMVIIALVFAGLITPSAIAWVTMGQMVRQLLSDPRWLRIFNLTMALLLVASLWPVLTM